jgi:hypothetical protein
MLLFASECADLDGMQSMNLPCLPYSIMDLLQDRVRAFGAFQNLAGFQNGRHIGNLVRGEEMSRSMYYLCLM